MSLSRPHSLAKLLAATVALFAFVALVAFARTGVASAQTVRDAAREHVRKNLEKKKVEQQQQPQTVQPPQGEAQPAQGEPQPAQSQPQPAQPPQSEPQPAALPPADTETRQPEAPPQTDAPAPGTSPDTATRTFTFASDEPEAPREPLPRRVFGKHFQLDLKLDGGYRGWVPQQYSSAKVSIAGYYTWSAEVKAKIWVLNLHRGYYESNALAAPRTQEASIAAQAGSHVPTAAWAMGMIGFPLLKVWEPIVRYEARAFNTTATPQIPVCVLNRHSSGSTDLATCPRSRDPLHIVSSFETLVGGVQYNAREDRSPVVTNRRGQLPLYFGVGLLWYNKPYQLTVDGNTLGDVLFDGRFFGGGLAAGTQWDGGLDAFFGHVNAQAGVGRVALTHDLTLNELGPERSLIGYVQGDLGLGYRFVLVKGPPTLALTAGGSAGGASFHFLTTEETDTAMGGKAQQVDTPNVNWDFLWSVRGALLVAF